MSRAKFASDWTAYYPRYPRDFIGGVVTAGMSFAQEGFYSRFLDLQWIAQAPLDDDVVKLARAMHAHPTTVKTLLEQLVAMGPSKITRVAGKIYNPRMQREIDKHNKRMLAAQARQSENPAGGAQRQLPLVQALQGGLAGQRPAAARGVAGRPRAGAQSLAQALDKLGRTIAGGGRG